MIIKAVVKKLKSDDGLIEFFDDIQIGKEYFVETKSVEKMKMYNVEKNILHEKLMIKEIDTDKYLPVDLLLLITIDENKELMNNDN